MYNNIIRLREKDVKGIPNAKEIFSAFGTRSGEMNLRFYYTKEKIEKNSFTYCKKC